MRDLLAHRSGVIGAGDGFSLEELADDRRIAERLAGQRLFWRPGTAFGYNRRRCAVLGGETPEAAPCYRHKESP